MELADLGLAATGGGVFGLLGTALGRVAGYFEQKQAHGHERERWSHERDLLDLQARERREETEADLIRIEREGSWEGLSASLEADASIGSSYPWVNAVRALTRPFLTVFLWTLTGVVYFNAGGDEQTGIVEAIIFAGTAATLWWFGDRGPNGRNSHQSLGPSL